MRNVPAHVPRGDRKMVAAAISAIFAQDARERMNKEIAEEMDIIARIETGLIAVLLIREKAARG